MQVAEEHPVAGGKVAAVAGVDAVDDDIQRRLLVLASGAAAVGGLELARRLLEFDVAFVGLHEFVVVQPELTLEVVHLDLLGWDELDQPTAELVFLLHVGVEHPDNLANESVPADEATQVPPELVAIVLVLGHVSVHDRLQDARHLAEGPVVLPLLAGEPREERVDVALSVDAELAQDTLRLIDEVDIHVALQQRLLIERLERLLDILLRVDEVQDVSVVLPLADTVQARERLHGLHALELRIDDHRMQQWLIESGLVLVRHDQAVEVLVELLLRLQLGDVRAVGAHVQAGLRVLLVAVLHHAGERHEDVHVVVAVPGEVALDLMVVPYGGQAGRRDDHHLAPATDLVHRGGPEHLDDDLGFLGDVVRVKFLILANDLRGPRGRQVGVVRYGLGDAVTCLVCRVVQQYVHDEPLLDGLPHRIDVKRAVLAVGVLAAEKHQSLRLRRSRKSIVRKVRVLAVRGHLLDEAEHLVIVVPRRVEFLHVLGVLGFRLCRVREGSLRLQGRRAGLRGVGLVYDDGIVAPRDLVDILINERELLYC